MEGRQVSVYIAHRSEASCALPSLAATDTAYSHAFAMISGLVVVGLAAGCLHTARILRGVTVELHDCFSKRVNNRCSPYVSYRTKLARLRPLVWCNAC